MTEEKRPVHRWQVQWLLLATLKENPDNPRKHAEKDIQALRGSIKKYGPRWPIMVNNFTDRMIVAGHGRKEAAIAEGHEEWPVIDASDLSPEEVDEFMTVDNRTAELSLWDEEKLGQGFKRRGGKEIPGFDVADIQTIEAKLLRAHQEEAEKEVPPLTDPIAKLGDLYILGRHRILCGDCRRIPDWEKLMGDKQADMIFTDPPYNVDYEGEAGKIMNDKMDSAHFRQFLMDAFIGMFRFAKPGAVAYVCHADSEGYNFRGAFVDAGWLLKQVIIWAKDSFTLGRQDYQWQHEPILKGRKPSKKGHEPIMYGWKEGAGHNALEDRSQGTVWEYPKPHSSKDHPTMKPVELVARAIKNSTKEGDLVVDGFGGSGSTLIACERTRRTCYSMELDPRYVDVIVRRWVALTGEQPILQEGQV